MGETPAKPVISSAVVGNCQAVIRWTEGKMTSCPLAYYTVEVQDYMKKWHRIDCGDRTER